VNGFYHSGANGHTNQAGRLPDCHALSSPGDRTGLRLINLHPIARAISRIIEACTSGQKIFGYARQSGLLNRSCTSKQRLLIAWLLPGCGTERAFAHISSSCSLYAFQ